MHVSGHTAKTNLIGERFIFVSLSYRYRVQCDRGLRMYLLFAIVHLVVEQEEAKTPLDIPFPVEEKHQHQ